jgi:hypothetical protein
MSTITGQTRPNKHRYWTDDTGRKFELLNVYSPREDIEDQWVEYQNRTTGDTYSCREEAFRARFRPLPD